MTAWASTISDLLGVVDSGGQPFDPLGIVDSVTTQHDVPSTWNVTISDVIGAVDSGTVTYSSGDWVGITDSVTVASTPHGLSSEPLGVGDTNDSAIYNVEDVLTDVAGIVDSVVTTTGLGVVPVVVVNYLWRREIGSSDEGVRIATVIPNGSYTDWAVAHRQGYEYRAEAVGTNGTASLSAWT